MTDRVTRRSTCHDSGVRMLRALTMLSLGLTSVGGWQMTALPVPSGHAQCASSQASARQAVAPRMCGYDHLSSEFQARRRHPAPCRSIQSCRHLSLPSRRRRGWRTSARARSLASLARCCSSTRQTARGCCSSTPARRTRACTLTRPCLLHAYPRTIQAGSQRALARPRQVHAAGPTGARDGPRHVRARVRAARGGVPLRDDAAGKARPLSLSICPVQPPF